MSTFFNRCVTLLSASLVFAASAVAATTPSVLVRPQARVTDKIDNKQLSVLRNTTPAVVASAADHGRLASSTRLNHMLLVLKSSDEQEYALHSLIDAQQDKASPDYHKWMTPEAFNAAFGVASSDITSVDNWLKDSGFAVEKVSAGGRVIEFSGTSGQVESAFHTEIHNVTVDGETHFTNTVDFSVPSALSPVVAGISKLNNFARKANAVNPHPVVKGKDGQFYPVIPGTSEPDYTSLSSGSHYVGPGDLATIYNGTPLLNTGINGKGQTIGVIGQTAINLSNVQTYRSMFRLPTNDPQIVNVGPPPATIADDLESDLDVELAGSLATQAKVLFYTAGLGGFYDVGIDVSALEAVDLNVADIISLSYGGCEKNNGASGTAYWTGLWEQAAAQGQTVFVSTGDSSATGCASSSAVTATGANAVYGVNALGSSPYNVAVGGTGFFEDLSVAEAAKGGVTKYWSVGGVPPYTTALSYIPETVYSDGAFDVVVQGSGVAGGGGGVSMFAARPSWQVAPGITAADPAGPTYTTAGAIPAGTPHRLVPDLSFIASSSHDATIFCSEGVCKLDSAGNVIGIGAVGGTSVATPAMASVQALINQKNGGRQGNANFFYYKLAAAQASLNCASTSATPAAGCNFYDTVTGSNYSPLKSTARYDVSTGTITGTLGTDYIGFPATAGYDEATGLGSPNITNLANNWSTVTFNSTTTKLTLSPTTTTHGTSVSATVTVAAGSGTPSGQVSFTAVGQTPAGPGDGNNYTLAAGTVITSLTSLPGGTYSVVAHYGGDGTYAASDSAPVTVTIAKEDSTTFLTPGQASSGGSLTQLATYPYGLSVYLETEVQGNSATAVNGNDVLNTGVPTGAVTYALSTGGTALTPVTANLDVYGTSYLEIGPSYSAYSLNANYPALPPATYAATASYPGDNSFNASSAAAAFTIVKASATPVLRTASAEIASAATATFNVTIAASGAGVLPSGTITLTDNTTATVLGTGSLVNGAVVITTTKITTNGGHSVVASYSGDTNYNATNSTATTVTVGGAASTLTLAASATAIKVLNFVTFTATAPTAVTGTVYFYDGATLLSSAAISTTTHTAVLTTSALLAGTRSITATYAGSSTYQSSTSAAVQVVVSQNTPTMTLTSQQANNTNAGIGMNAVFTPNPLNVNAAGTALVAAVPAPSVPVQFMDGTKVLGTAPLTYTLNYHTYAAAFSTTTLGPGPHSLTAVFPGDANYAAVTSAAQNISVGATVTTVAVPSGPVTVGVPFSLSATVTPVTVSTVGVGGTITFYNGPVKLGTANVTNGTAVLPNAIVGTTGTQSISAVYSGDPNYDGSTGTLNVTVTVGATTTTVTVPSNAVTVGVPFSVSASVAPKLTASTLAISGSVTFYNGAVKLGMAPLTNGTAVLPNAIVTATGTQAISAVYSGDPNYATSTGSANVNVVVGATTTTLTSSTIAAGTGVPFMLSATVTPKTAGSTLAVGGTVIFYDGSTKLGTANVTNGVATLSNVIVSTVGTHVITAVYSGDPNYAGSNSTSSVSVSAVTPGISLLANPADINVVQGDTNSVVITATSFGQYTGNLAFSCAGLPSGATCAFSPASIAIAANSTAQTKFSVATTGGKSKAGFTGILWLPVMLLGGVFAWRRKQFTKRGYQLMALALLFVGVSALTGCGSGGSTGTPRGVTTLTVTAAATGTGTGSGSTTATIHVNLYVY